MRGPLSSSILTLLATSIAAAKETTTTAPPEATSTSKPGPFKGTLYPRYGTKSKGICGLDLWNKATLVHPEMFDSIQPSGSICGHNITIKFNDDEGRARSEEVMVVGSSTSKKLKEASDLLLAPHIFEWISGVHNGGNVQDDVKDVDWEWLSGPLDNK